MTEHDILRDFLEAPHSGPRVCNALQVLARKALDEWAEGLRAEEAEHLRNEIIARQNECKPEADGFITVHPKLD